MCAGTLAFEAVVIALSVPVMITVSDVDRGPAFAAGLGLAGLALLTAGLLRHSWAYALGWLVQAGVLALGVVTAAMYVIGALFGALWVLALVLGRRVELLKAARDAEPGRYP
jgi:hypothetical protein